MFIKNAGACVVMRIVLGVLIALVCAGVVSAVISSQLKAAPAGLKGVKGSIELGPRAGARLDEARKPKVLGVQAYESKKGFKGAVSAPKGVINLKLSTSKIDEERKAMQAKKSQPAKYQALVNSLKRNATVRR